jgi:hypothetical protein
MAKKSGPKLFFLTGRLQLRGIPKRWEKPDTEAKYEKQIKGSDFLVEEDLKTYGLDTSPTVKEDVQDLRNLLLEPFFRANQKAKHYQNDYFRQQWILVLGTFLTAVIATFTVIFNPATPMTASDTPQTVQATAEATATAEGATSDSGVTLPTISVSPTDAARGAGVITAIITFVTSIVTYQSQAQKPQYNWHLWRTLAEELRRHYFLYLSHLPPYQNADYAEVLERSAAQIETQQSQEEKQGATSSSQGLRTPHTEAEAQALVRLYRNKRVQIQHDFYENRIAEYELNANFVTAAGVVLVALATFLSTLNAYLGSQVIILLIALLPVIASLLVSFEKIYGWVRQVSLYSDAYRRLKIDNTIPPVEGKASPRPYHEVLTDFVSSVENTLKSEMSQWGQNVLQDGSNIGALSAQDTLEMALAKSKLDPQQMEIVRQMFKETES